MAGEHLPGKTLLEALNTHLACDAINVAMREIFKQMVYGRTQTAFSENGLPIGASLEDLGKMMDLIRAGKDHKEAYESCIGTYGQYEGASEYIDPRKE